MIAKAWAKRKALITEAKDLRTKGEAIFARGRVLVIKGEQTHIELDTRIASELLTIAKGHVLRANGHTIYSEAEGIYAESEARRVEGDLLFLKAVISMLGADTKVEWDKPEKGHVTIADTMVLK